MKTSSLSHEWERVTNTSCDRDDVAHQLMGMLHLESITTFRVVAVQLHGRIGVYTYDTHQNTRVWMYENMSV